MTTYTIVAYRPDGVDTCRNCVMGRSSSDFELRVFRSAEEAADFWAAKDFESAYRAREYCSWELTLLVDGLDYETWDQVHGNDTCEEPPHTQVEARSKALLGQRQAAKAEAEHRARAQAEVEAAAQRAAQAAAREQEERAELRRLLKEYGSPEGTAKP